MTDDTQEMEIQGRRIAMIVPKQHVKTVKTVLEKHGQLDRTRRIVPEEATSSPLTSGCVKENIKINLGDAETPNLNGSEQSEQRMCIPTTILNQPDLAILQDPALLPIASFITLSLSTASTLPPQTNPLHKALTHALSTLPPPTLTELHLTSSSLVSAFPTSYSIYPPLLLLPPNVLSSTPWKVLASHASVLSSIWPHVATAMGVTHVAINSPIPPSRSTTTSNPENILRSPLNLTPLHGSFPTSSFATALWIRTTQNHIHQTWSPLHTMFSRGNVREKARVLSFPNIRNATIVDMYAGIGYFTFSYKAAGAACVLCFELNAWSVEGLRRGAAMNGWNVRIVTEEDVRSGTWDGDVRGVDFVVCHMSNTHALHVLAKVRNRAAIRHVNLGLLPRSRDSWRDSVALVDAAEGGWVHAHENVGVGDMKDRKQEVESVFRGYAGERIVEVRHVERVKMYAPGVVHCVFDVWVGGVEGRS
jgi:tRNA wybutosine-synthesizing protein 2